jgi:flagella basal body P-ring formation protein FlgA
MTRFRPGNALCVLAVLTSAVNVVSAFEIQLRDVVKSRSGIIRLSDVATVDGVDDQLLRPLEQIALAPAPAPSRSRSLSASQIRNILVRRGVALTGCRFTGAPRVHVLGRDVGDSPEESPVKITTPETRSGRDLATVKQQLTDAVVRQLPTEMDDQQWSVDVDLARQELWGLPATWQEIRLVGLNAASEQRQEIVAEFVNQDQVVQVPIHVDLQPRPMAVIATRDLERGQIVQQDDVKLCAIDSAPRGGAVAIAVEEVVGKQLTRRVIQGQLIRAESVQRPLLVHRREVVDVIVRNGAISVRRKAQALDDGALGDVIQLATLDQQKSKLQARVIGPRSAEISLGQSIARREIKRR